ncbi:glycosyltransferase [Parabacteroides sp. FAFU027]|uniref:glycosyltransferase n=1 Tax=Parabacteroides sp. FAFU027 TaxID=2922715 RepID=UPI001FAEB3E1|nr:glycosyltransferase [Parabacteroides sp. FAFU027]
MKILILPSWYLPGRAYFIQEQALFIQEQGIEVDVLANVSLSVTFDQMKYLTSSWKSFSQMERGLLTYRCFTRQLPKSEKFNIEYWVKKTLDLFEKYQLEQGLPDLIHVHSSTWGGLAAAIIKERFGVTYVITEHRGVFALQSEFSIRQFPAWKDPYYQKTFENADFIIPVSDQLMRKISIYSGEKVPWKAVPNIVDTDFFHYKERDPNKPFHFICANGFYKVKGYDILLKAFDRFCEKHPDVKLSIAGEYFDSPKFQKILSDCLNRDKIVFTGELSREEVRELMHSADAFLLSSRVESQSIATVEALSTGLPVVCTDVVPEFVVPSFCGYRVPNEDPEAFAGAMLRMVKNIESFDRKRLSQHARNIAHKEVIVRQLIEIYNQVLNSQ